MAEDKKSAFRATVMLASASGAQRSPVLDKVAGGLKSDETYVSNSLCCRFDVRWLD